VKTNETSGPIKWEEFLNLLNDCELLKDSASWSFFFCIYEKVNMLRLIRYSKGMQFGPSRPLKKFLRTDLYQTS
jgi:hypothetical protein